MVKTGTIEQAIGLPNPYSLAELDLYARRVEKWAWQQMIPQASEVVATYYFNLTGNGSETGAGTTGDPYVSFASLNSRLAAHDPEDVIEFRVRTDPSLNFLFLNTSNKVVLNSTTPELRWLPWKGQARFSHATTNLSSSWTNTSGTTYKRTMTKPGWVANARGSFIYPAQWKYVDTTAEVDAELYTWHHDGTDLYVNDGLVRNVSQPLRSSPNTQDSLIDVSEGSGRILIQGVHCEGFGCTHDNIDNDRDASGIKVSHGYNASRGYADKLLLANCADYCTAAHPMSVTGQGFGDEISTAPTAVLIDCRGGGGYEFNKAVGPFNMYNGDDAEFALIRCVCDCGPAQQDESKAPTQGHSNAGDKIGLFYEYDFLATDLASLVRSTGQYGTPGIPDTDVKADNPFQRAVIARHKHLFRRSTGSISGFAPDGKNIYNGYYIDMIYRGDNTNFGRSTAGTFQIGDGIMVNSVLKVHNTTNLNLRLWGDGTDAAPQKYVNCMWILSSDNLTAFTFGINLDLDGMEFINCIFAVLDGSTLAFETTNPPSMVNCGFYRCTAPGYATDSVVLDNIDPYIAAYESQLLGAGASVSSYGTVEYDGNGRRINSAAPPLGPFGSITQFAG